MVFLLELRIISKYDLDLFNLGHCIHPSLSFPQGVLQDRDDGIWMNACPAFSPPEEMGLWILALKWFPLGSPAVAPSPHTVREGNHPWMNSLCHNHRRNDGSQRRGDPD